MMLCMGADGPHSTMQRASESSEEAWVFETVARCSLIHRPLLTGPIQSQECDHPVSKELPNSVVPLLMFSSCELPQAPLVDENLSIVQKLKGEEIKDVNHSLLELKSAMLPSKYVSIDPASISVDAHNHAIRDEEHTENLSAVSGIVAVTKLSETTLKDITCVSMLTGNYEVSAFAEENGIRPSSTESSIKVVDAVHMKDTLCKSFCKNDSENSQSKQDEEMLNTLRALEQRCNALNEENIMLRKGIFPETEEKVKRLKKKNTELALIAKRLEERAQKLQEANLKMVSTPVHLKGVGLEVCKKAYARQRAKDMSDQASALLAKDKQIETLKQECRNLQAKLSTGKEFPSWLKLSDFERLLRESQKEVLRLQRQIAVKFLKDSLQLSRSSSRNHLPNDAVCINSVLHSDQSTDDEIKESELRTKRKECEILEQEVKKKQKRCETLESKLQEVQTENVRLVEENSRLSDKINWTIKVECENADLRDQLFVVTEQRDSALKESLRLQTKLENLEQVLKHMRNVIERRQQLKKDHEDAVISLQKRQEEVKRLQQAQVEAKKEHEGAVHLLENTLDNLQAKVKLLEEKCRSQTEQFSLLSQELERFRLQTGNIDLLTSTLVTSELPPPQCCSTPGVTCVQQDNEDDSWDKEKPVLPKLEENSKNEEPTNNKSSELSNTCCKSSDGEVQSPAVAKEKEKSEPPRTPSKSESTHESRKSCPTPEVDTASEMEELEADSVSLIPDSVSRSSAKLQVFLARYSYNPFDGPNENPEAELPLTAGEYIYIYGDMDDDGFYEGELMDGRRGLVPSNFVERVSDDDLMAFQPVESNELSQSSGQDISFLSGSSIEKSEEDEDESSLSPCQGNSEGASDVSAVPYPRKLTLIKQLARSVVVSWEPPLVAAGSANIQSYNIFVDHELRQNVRCGGQTKALIEKLELKTRTYRISVQSMTEKGGSDRMRCTMLIGYGYSLAPTQLRVCSLSATSAEITWQPCNSNYSHALHLNEESCGFTKPGTYWFSFTSLRPSSIYNIKVEARPQRIPWEMSLERREQKSTVMQLTTPCAGPPDAPLDVQVELGPTPGVLLISWLPVTIDAAGTSNGVRVTGYAVYADGQKVLEVTSPTAGSVLVGMSHLQLLHVSREITVRTMSPSGESVASVPAHIPSALLKVPDFGPFLQPLSNTSLICEPASGHSFDTCSEKSPLMPLKLFSSPHLLPSPSSEAKFSNDANGRQGESIDSLSAGVSRNQVLTTINAPSCFSQESSISECSDVLQHCIRDTPLTPQSMENLPLPSNSHNLDVSSILLNERETKLHEEHMNILNAKEPAVHEFKLQKALTEDRLPELCTSSMEDIPSKETVKVEEAVDSRVNLRGNSIEEFLEGAGTDRKESDKNELKGGLLENHETSHVEHSRSSNLSDILEEEEEDEDDCNIASSETKWQLSMGGDAPGKLDCCETDSDEEILERILDLPLQKQCSKKLFSIPEVTEEEEDEEDNFPVSVAKVTSCCKAEKHKYQKEVQSNLCIESLHTFPQLPRDICEQMSKKKCGKTSKVECVVEDCKFQDEEWNMNTKDCISQQQPNSLMSPVGITKKSCHLNDRARYTYDSNKRRQSDGQEHCSRMAANPVQSVLYPPRSHNYRDQLVCNTGKETSQISQKLMKAKTQKSLQKQSTCGLNTKTSSLGGLEINIEYDTEDEEDPFSTDQFMQRTKAHVLVDGCQTDQDGWSDCSSQSETIQFNKYRKGMKRPERVQDWKAELDGSNILPHSKNIQIAHGISSNDSGNKLSINKSMRAAQWDCAGKDWNGASRTSVLPGSTSETASAKNTRAGQLISDTESEATHNASSECCQSITPEKLSPSKHQSSELRRLFVALFDYDPLTMSPNPDSHEELPFKEGQIIQVFADKDTDGFYQGECAGKVGYIPCNMVSEIYIESQDIRNELVKHGSLTSPTLLNELGIRDLCPPGRQAIPPPKPRRSKKVQSTSVTEKKKIPVKSRRVSKPEKSIPKAMEAIFDYNPKENSPNTDVEAELSFTAGDIITVYGPMDEDGFYYGELKGQRGLVPSNFLAVSQAETEGPIHQGEKESNFEDSMDETNSSLEDHISCNQASDSKATLQVQDMGQDITSSKKRKGFFSKGRKLFKKLGSSGKNL